jgi:hypothetical protein
VRRALVVDARLVAEAGRAGAFGRRAGAGLCGLLVAVAVLGTIGCRRADAFVSGGLTSTEASRLPDLTQWLYRNGAVTSAGPPCDVVCLELWSEEHRVAPVELASPEVPTELAIGLEESPAPLLPLLGRAIPFIGLGVGAFTLGWKIGGQIDKWLGIDVAAAPAANRGGIVGLRYASRGETDVFLTFQDVMAMPFDGYYIQSSDRNAIVAQSSPTASQCDEGDPGMIAGYIELSWHWSDCFAGYGQPLVPLTAHAYVVNPFQHAIQDFTGQHVDATSPGVPDPGQAAVEQNLQTTLASGTTQHLRDWLDRELARFATMPDCKGQTQPACTLLLEHAGLSSPVEVLRLDAADPTVPANAIVSSDPGPGATLLKTQTVTLHVNPDLDQAGLTTYFNENRSAPRAPHGFRTRDEARIGYSACRALRSREDCLTIPTIFPGADTPQARDHVHDAIFLQAKPPDLQYAVPQSRAPKGWYKRGAANACTGKTGLTLKMDCDEYPYLSTREGGPGASLRPIDASDNHRAGARLGELYSRCGVRRDQASFLVIPLAATPAIPTVVACNGKN